MFPCYVVDFTLTPIPEHTTGVWAVINKYLRQRLRSIVESWTAVDTTETDT